MFWDLSIALQHCTPSYRLRLDLCCCSPTWPSQRPAFGRPWWKGWPFQRRCGRPLDIANASTDVGTKIFEKICLNKHFSKIMLVLFWSCLLGPNFLCPGPLCHFFQFAGFCWFSCPHALMNCDSIHVVTLPLTSNPTNMLQAILHLRVSITGQSTNLLQKKVNL